MKKWASSDGIRYLHECVRGRWKSFCGVPMASPYVCLGEKRTSDVFLMVSLAQCVLGWFSPRWKALCLHLAWFSPEAQVWAAGRGWEVPDDANHLTAFLIRLLLCRTFSPFRLVPRVYVCCEHEATKNVGFWMRKTEGCICLRPFLAQGLASHPGSLSLSFPLCQMGVLIPALNVYVYVG